MVTKNTVSFQGIPLYMKIILGVLQKLLFDVLPEEIRKVVNLENFYLLVNNRNRSKHGQHTKDHQQIIAQFITIQRYSSSQQMGIHHPRRSSVL